jgi:hypothetical protein
MNALIIILSRAAFPHHRRGRRRRHGRRHSGFDWWGKVLDESEYDRDDVKDCAFYRHVFCRRKQVDLRNDVLVVCHP